jgi:MHS family proline/betaine transporter-like MFS transporter
VAAVVVTFNMFFVFMPGYLTTLGTASLEHVLAAALVGLVLGSLSAPAFGALSDRRGRRPLILGGLVGVLVAAMPAALLVARGDTASMIAGYSLIGIALGALPIAAFLAELFPTRLRYSGLSLTYGLASAVFGGTAPFVAALLVRLPGGPRTAVWYATAVAAVAATAARSAPETAHRPLDVGAEEPGSSAPPDAGEVLSSG